MKGIALGISYLYEFMALPGHSWRLFKLREQRNLRAYAFIQETMEDLDGVTLTYWELRKSEARLINSELFLGFNQRAHLDSLRAAIARVRLRARENTPDLTAAA